MAIIRDHTAKDVASSTVAVVIPCYRTEGRVIDVLTEMPAFVDHVFCVDDACPEGIGDVIERHMIDIGFMPSADNAPKPEAEKKVVGMENGPTLRQCPKCCQAALLRQEGCDTCTACDYSKCG